MSYKKQGSADAMSSAASDRVSPKKPSATLIRAFEGAMSIHMDEIQTEAGGDLELQLMLVKFIRDYKEVKNSASENLTTVGDVMHACIADRKRKRDDDEDTPGNPTSIEDTDIRRGQHIYAMWSTKLVDDLLCYLEPSLFDRKALKRLSLQVKYQVMEMGLDLIMHGDSLDRIGCTNKRELYGNLSKAYDKLGRRFQWIEIDMERGVIDWSMIGPWSMQKDLLPTDGNLKVVLKSWALARDEDFEVLIKQDSLLGDEGPFNLDMQFSLKQCSLVSASTNEHYGVMQLVPGLRRRLCHRPSDEAGATSLCSLIKKTSVQWDDEKNGKKAKAKPLGMKSIAPITKSASGAGGVASGEAPVGKDLLVSKANAAAQKSPATAQAKVPGVPSPKVAALPGVTPIDEGSEEEPAPPSAEDLGA
jgi:hypothetical protein